MARLRLLGLYCLIGLAVGCDKTYQAVGICEGLQISDLSGKLWAVCWTDEADVFTAANREELIGPHYPGVREILDAFAEERAALELRARTQPRLFDGFRYQLSFPAIVDVRNQYVLEIVLPRPVEADKLSGPAREVVEFVKSKQGRAHKVDVDLVPIGNAQLGVTLHLEDWVIKTITVTHYVAR